MNPWRAALTSATASGNSTRIASRSAAACSSTEPLASTCASAAEVSSTAVFSVSVANCSRCASCTVSACCSANWRSWFISSSGSPPNGSPNPPSISVPSLACTSSLPSAGQLAPRFPLELAQALVPGRRDVAHVEAAEQRECDHADERRTGVDLALVAPLVVAAEDREAAQVDLDASRHVDVRPAEHRHHPDRHDGVRELRTAQAEVDAREDAECQHAPGDAPAPLQRRAAEDPEHQAAPPLAGGRRDGGKIRDNRLELGLRPRGVGVVGPLGELRERQAALDACLAQAHDGRFALRVGKAQLELVAQRTTSRLYERSMSCVRSSTAPRADCIACANGETPTSPSACSSLRVAVPISSR